MMTEHTTLCVSSCKSSKIYSRTIKMNWHEKAHVWCLPGLLVYENINFFFYKIGGQDTEGVSLPMIRVVVTEQLSCVYICL